MGKRKKALPADRVRVIKIGKEALFEYIYENILGEQGRLLDIPRAEETEVTDLFDINFERGEFICCVYKSEGEDENLLRLPEGIDLQRLMEHLPDTTDSLLSSSDTPVYREYSMDELIEASKERG